MPFQLNIQKSRQKNGSVNFIYVYQELYVLSVQINKLRYVGLKQLLSDEANYMSLN